MYIICNILQYCRALSIRLSKVTVPFDVLFVVGTNHTGVRLAERTLTRTLLQLSFSITHLKNVEEVVRRKVEYHIYLKQLEGRS